MMNEPTKQISALSCPACGAQKTYVSTENDTFMYGTGDDTVQISVRIPVHHCSSCDLAFTGEEASELRHEAVCNHLGVMTPRQIRNIREQYGLSQTEFSQISRIGKASLARWESGSLIQNYANDSLLYLLTFAENVGRLKHRFAQAIDEASASISKSSVLQFAPRFKEINPAEASRRREEAQRFELYAAEAA